MTTTCSIHSIRADFQQQYDVVDDVVCGVSLHCYAAVTLTSPHAKGGRQRSSSGGILCEQTGLYMLGYACSDLSKRSNSNTYNNSNTQQQPAVLLKGKQSRI
eukprot:17392-Heterococcus_DN1.PRE.1